MEGPLYNKNILLDETKNVLLALGIDLSNASNISNERIRSLNCLMTMENYRTQSFRTLIKFANTFLSNPEVTDKSLIMIKNQEYRPLESNNVLDMY